MTPTTAKPSLIASTTKVSLGVVGAFLVYTVAVVLYMSNLNSTVEQLVKAVEANTSQLKADGRAMAILETLVSTMERRITILEAKDRENPR